MGKDQEPLDMVGMESCPFCGEDILKMEDWSDKEGGPCFVILCDTCGCLGPMGAESPDVAAEMWNDRS